MAILNSIIVTGYNRPKVCTSLPNNNHAIAVVVHTASIDSNRNFTTDKSNLDFRFNLKIKGCIRLHHQIVTFYQYPDCCFTMAIHKCALDSQMETHIDKLSILELFLQWVIARQQEFIVMFNLERILPRSHHQKDLSS